MESLPVGSTSMAPGTLASQGAHTQARAMADGAANASRDDFQTRRAEQTEPPQNARSAQDARTEQLRTEREQEATRAASSDTREREDNTYTASASAARFGGGQSSGSMVDLRA